MGSTLKDKAISALIWNAIQRYGVLLISFLSNIVLARLLTPDDYGVVGLLTVFTALAGSVVDSGFSAALIQRKKVSQTDWSTVFFWNIAASILMYLILLITANSIAGYFKQPILADILRFQSLTLLVNALCSVQTAKLTKELQFKRLAIRSIVGNLIGGCVGIILAINGFGVWSLAWQTVAISIASTLLLWSIAEWRPTFEFSMKSFKEMYKFGGFIFISGICDTLYSNLQSFIIGRFFSIRELGLYSQAKKVERVPVEGTSTVLSQVLFPVYASIASDREIHKKIVRKNITIITYITFPLMVMLIMLAAPIFYILFGTKWMEAVPMFQILCIFGMFSPLNRANSEIFRAIGDGKAYFNLQTTKQIIALTLILCFVRFGIYPFLWACTAVSITSYGVNIYFTHTRFGYTCRQQLNDILPNLFISVTCGLLGYYFLHVLNFVNDYVQIFVGICIFCLLYIICTYFFRLKGYKLLLEIIKGKKLSKQNN